MTLIVQKYGGMCLAEKNGLMLAARRIAETVRAGDRVVAVVSARGKATDELLAATGEISADAPLREVDALLSTGEQASAAFLAIALESLGLPSVSFGPHQCGILASDGHGHAKVVAVDVEPIRKALSEGKVPVVTGFVGVNEKGDIATLGRGATDKTAVVLAHALGADACEVYKDVAGLASADPKKVPAARRIDRISFDEMLELSATGAKILQADAVEIAKRFRIPLSIRPHFASGEGTRIDEELQGMEKAEVAGCTLSTEEAIVTLSGVPDRPGQLTRIFEGIAAAAVNVDTILVTPSLDGTSQVAFSVPVKQLDAALRECESLRKHVGLTGISRQKPVSKISIVGVGMQQRHGVAAKMFRALSAAHVNILAVTTSEIKITCAVAAAEGEKGLRAVHTAFGLDKN